MNDIGQRIKDLRETNHLSQVDIAKILQQQSGHGCKNGNRKNAAIGQITTPIS